MTSLTALRQVAARVAAPPMIRGVIFDLDGTLLDSEPIYRRAFREALAAFDRAIDETGYAQLIGMATPDRMGLLARRFGRDFPANAFQVEYYRQKQRHLADGVPLKTGALDLLAWLEARGIRSAVATASSDGSASRHLRQAGLHKRFRAVLTRDQVTRRKPHPDLLLHAARALDADPAHCLVLEDSGPGIEAAEAAGAVPILIPDLAPVAPHIRRKSFAVLPDLHAVRAMLAGD